MRFIRPSAFNFAICPLIVFGLFARVLARSSRVIFGFLLKSAKIWSRVWVFWVVLKTVTLKPFWISSKTGWGRVYLLKASRTLLIPDPRNGGPWCFCCFNCRHLSNLHICQVLFYPVPHRGLRFPDCRLNSSLGSALGGNSTGQVLLRNFTGPFNGGRCYVTALF